MVVLGLYQRLEGEAMSVSAERFKCGDRVSIGLPKEQEVLLKHVKVTGKLVVLVVNAGGAIAIIWATENVDAILDVAIRVKKVKMLWPICFLAITIQLDVCQ